MNYQAPPPNNKPSVMTTVAIAAIVASIAANLFLLYQVNGLKDDSLKNKEILQGEIDTLKENSTAMTAAQRKHLDEVKEDLDTSKRQLSAQANQAKEGSGFLRRRKEQGSWRPSSRKRQFRSGRSVPRFPMSARGRIRRMRRSPM